ncbi:autotransporter assembly complex protein TamA [Crenobacter cavernae]|uniref:Outer membrane protein assembly factor n=1 Tax=Crenobacter cavernae TaxID=2290923 RepID=A0A345Y5A6_9NEIS|nr:autotransporter assembly complex family protein [Crenobacter cavernae]AXK39108.1 outer membrane protein assembly factor [Crenobacter cavernae]
MLSTRYLRLVALAGLVATQYAHGALDYTVRVAAPSGLSSLLSEHLELINRRDDPDMDEALLASLVQAAPDAARALLETEGYFKARVSVREDGPHAYAVIVDAGSPVLITDLTVVLDGPIRQEPDYQQRLAAALEAWPLPLDAPFRQAEWTGGKKAVLRLLVADRFPKARLADSRADVDPDTGRAELAVRYDSGPRIAFGALTVTGLKRYPQSIALGLADFKEGDPYKLSKIIDYQNALEQDPHFSGAVVSADFDAIKDDRVPVSAALTEFPRQKVELGLLYSKSEGPGVRVGYDHYNIFNRALTGAFLADLKQNEKTVSFGLGFPRNHDGYSHSANLSYKVSDVQGLDTQALTAGVWRIRQRGNIEARIGLELESEQSRLGGIDQGHVRAVLLSYGWARRALDDAQRPRNGSLLEGQLSGTLGGALSDTTFVRGYGRAAYYWTPQPKFGTFVARAELGQVWASDTNRVPSSRLFRTGGASTVRGYDYQSLGVPGPKGSVDGGRVLGVASLEYQYPITRTVSGALFYDAGDAARDWQTFDLAKGYGVGVRWASPVAPFAFDVARGERDGKLRWYIGLGLAF